MRNIFNVRRRFRSRIRDVLSVLLWFGVAAVTLGLLITVSQMI